MSTFLLPLPETGGFLPVSSLLSSGRRPRDKTHKGGGGGKGRTHSGMSNSQNFP